MLKKIIAAALSLTLCFLVTACSSDGKKYMELKNAQDAILSLSSGKITVTTQLENESKSDTVKSELVFKANPSGIMSYCQVQYDMNNKAVYCEYSDGEKSEQWLVGKGWNVIDSAFYSKDNPHRYNALLATSFDKKAIDNIVCDESEKLKTYTIELDPKILNKTTYKDASFSIVTQSVCVLVNEKNEIVRYNDRSKVLDKETNKENLYFLEMVVSQANQVSKISRPELRDYSK